MKFCAEILLSCIKASSITASRLLLSFVYELFSVYFYVQSVYPLCGFNLFSAKSPFYILGFLSLSL